MNWNFNFLILIFFQPDVVKMWSVRPQIVKVCDIKGLEKCSRTFEFESSIQLLWHGVTCPTLRLNICFDFDLK